MSGVLAIIERESRISLESLAAGQELASALGLGLSVVVFEAHPALEAKLDHLYLLSSPLLESYTPDAYTAALEQLIRNKQPDYVFFPHTYQVRDYAPKLATRFHQVLVSDVTGFAVNDGKVAFVRQLFQGKLNAEVHIEGTAPHFISVQAGAFRAGTPQSAPAPMSPESFPVEIEPAQIRTKPEPPFRESERAVDLTAAGLIVSVGRGIKEQENIALVQELAKAMGAELAASRPICDNGWLPMERQVGSSGQTVSPKAYFAIGISGAIQHLVGMKGSKTIVAINKDPKAPIFEVADYGIVGDLFEIVPALTEELKRSR